MRTRIFTRGELLVAIAFLASAAPTTQAGLTYEVVNGASLIYDSTNGVTWTRDANLSGTAYLNQSDAATWAANLTTAGLTWQMPSVAELTSMFTQLDPVGPPGSQSNKYGSTVTFGPGANDYVSNVQQIYWTDTTGIDFNFNYGYGGGAMPGTAYYAWAVDPNAAPPSVPEPASAFLLLSGVVALGAAHRFRSKAKLSSDAIG